MHPNQLHRCLMGFCIAFTILCASLHAQQEPFVQCKSVVIAPDGSVMLTIDNDGSIDENHYEVYCTEERMQTDAYLCEDTYWRLIHKTTFATPLFNDQGEFIRIPPSDPAVPFRFYSIAKYLDSDNDGLSDAYEKLVTHTSPHLPDTDGNFVSDANEDIDGDGLTNMEEYERRSDPRLMDTDNDGLSDLVETNTLAFVDEYDRGTSPLDNDTDRDGLSDAIELFVKDCDGFESGDFSAMNWFPAASELPWEITTDTSHNGSFAARTPAALEDEQNSALTLSIAIAEEHLLSFYYKVSTEQSKDYLYIMVNGSIREMISGEQDWTRYTLILRDPGDYDISFIYQKDADNDAGEDAVWIDDVVLMRGTSPTEYDMDSDGLSDGEEIYFGSSPYKSDTDDDGISDQQEIQAYGTNPMMEDSDLDGLSDNSELHLGTDPVVDDSDDDSIPDGWENARGLNPLAADSIYDYDGDGLTNYEEYKMDSDPYNTYGQDPLIVYVDSAGTNSGTGTQGDPFHSLQKALDETPYTDGYSPYPVMFVLADGIYDLYNDEYMISIALDAIEINQDWLWNTYGDLYRVAIKGSSPEKCIIKAWGTAPVITIRFSYLYDYAPVLIKNITFTGGTTGIDMIDDKPVIVNCHIKDNKGNFGAGMFLENSDPEVINCLFTGNTSIQGSGIYVYSHSNIQSSPTVAHSTFAYNNGQEGTAIFLTGSQALANVFNSIIWEPNGDDLSGLTANMIKYSDIEDGDFYGQNGNISSDPLFALATADNFHLTASSPCINTAHPFGFFTPDTDNELRPVDTYCDMGFDEFQDTNLNDLPDYWENSYLGSFTATGDNDLDGVNNAIEAANMTNPTLSDTDGDGLNDYQEIITYGTNPHFDEDADGDGIIDYEEVVSYGTNPLAKDTDGDRIPDNWEIDFGLNPNVADGDQDYDSDFLTNYEEYFMYTDPYNTYDYDPYPYNISIYGSIQNALTAIYEDRDYYGNFAGLVYIDISGNYTETLELPPDVVFYANSPYNVTIKGNGSNNIINMYSDNDGNYQFNYYGNTSLKAPYGIGEYYVLFKNITISGGGRGIYARRWNMMFNNCIIRDNAYSYSPWNGGGIYAYNTSIESYGTLFELNQSNAYGGALYAALSNLTIENTVFDDNLVIKSGGAMYLMDSNLTIKSSTFQDNRSIFDDSGSGTESGTGGALHLENSGALTATASITDSLFTLNESFSKGGAVYATSTGVSLDNVTFDDNQVRIARDDSADGFGGAVFTDYCVLKATDSTFVDNSSYKTGGAVYAQHYYNNIVDSQFTTNTAGINGGGTVFYDSSANLTNVTFDQNHATGADGGALYFDYASGVVDTCLIQNNIANMKGAGIFAAGNNLVVTDSIIDANTTTSFSSAGSGLYVSDSDEFTLQRTTVSNNASAQNAGGIYLKKGTPLITESKIVNNTAGNWGGGVMIDDSTATIRNSIIKENSAEQQGGGIKVYSTINETTGIPENPAHATIENTIIKANSSLGSGGGVSVDQYARTDLRYSVIVENISNLNTGGGVNWRSPLLSYPLTIQNCVVWGNTDDLNGLDQTTVQFSNISDADFAGINGNVSLQPGFVNPSIDDYHIAANSELRDMGALYSSHGSDRDGETRPTSTDYSTDLEPRPLAGASDIGIDEFIDSDNDGLPDYWENQYGGFLDNDGDEDIDLVDNYNEYLNNTNPTLSDTDNDQLSDYEEIFVYFTNPLKNGDTDGDGIMDGDEINIYNTSPSKADTDADKIPDGWEIDHSLNPLVADGLIDNDGDLITNFEEYFIGSDPFDNSTPTVVDGSAAPDINQLFTTSQKRVVLLNAGTYNVDTLIIPSGNILKGADPDTTVLIGNAVSPTIDIQRSTGVIVKNLTIKNGAPGINNFESSAAIINCQLTDNTNSGVHISYAVDKNYILNTDFYLNQATVGGGLFIRSSAPEIINAAIYKNNAQTAGAIWVESSGINSPGPDIVHCNIVNNTAATTGGIHIETVNTNMSIRNTVIWGNGEDLYGSTAQSVSFCNIEDGDFSGQNNNISVDPGFGAPLFGRFHLKHTSPMIDAGDSDILYPVDLHNENRLIGSNVDIGIDEFLDADLDTLGDIWESTYGGDFSAASDDDTDTLTNDIEYAYFTDPTLSDTDADGLSDAEEINGLLYGLTIIYTDPLVSDMDKDGLTDGDEINVYGTNPTNSDTDDDGLDDAWEVTYSLDPTSDDATQDLDNDGLTNFEEFRLESEPNNNASPITIYVDSDSGSSYPGQKFASLSPAIQYIISNGYFPAMIYVADGTYEGGIEVPNKVALVGKNVETSIISREDSSALELNNAGVAIIKNLTLSHSAYGIELNKANPLIINCKIIDNVQQPTYGAGVNMIDSAPEFYDCLIRGNLASNNGGGVSCKNSLPFFERCVIKNNGISKSGGSGGGLYASLNSVVTLSDCRIEDNTSSSSGGGISAKDSTIELYHTIVTHNTANNLGGGGIYLNNSSGTIANSLITSNTGFTRGGGIYCNSSNPVILHSIIYDNTYTAQSGGGIYIENGSMPSIVNSIIWNNDDDVDNLTASMVSYCTIEDGDFDGENNNISLDPHFVNPSKENFHVYSDSPCIDAGNTESYALSDLDGENRPSNTHNDIGIDEVIDIDMDNLPDAWELKFVASINLLDNDTDGDTDTLTALTEFIEGTNPILADTDSDGLTDDEELYTYATNPLINDSDDDGLSDGDEINIHGTNPKLTDTDGDFIDDFYEVHNSLDPLSSSDAQLDPDSDNLTNLEEYYLGSHAQSDSSPASTYLTTNDSIQSTINAVSTPHKIILSPGTFIQPNTSNPAPIYLKSGIAIVNESGNPPVISTLNLDTVFILESVSNVVLKKLIIADAKQGIIARASNFMISNCEFRDIYAITNGAAIQTTYGKVLVSNSTFQNNAALFGGAIFSNFSSTLLTDNIFENNTAYSTHGGALYYSTYTGANPLKIVNCQFLNNKAALDGGALYGDNTSINCVDSSFSHNTAYNQGGGIYSDYSSINLTRTVMNNNFAYKGGGGLYAKSTSLDINHSIVTDNQLNTGTGGGIYLIDSDDVVIRNTVLWGNEDDLAGATSDMISYSTIQDADFVGTNGNIALSPEFIDAPNGNYHIKATSPLINAGTPTENASLDVDAETVPDGSASDIGLDEFIDTDLDSLADTWELMYAVNLTVLTAAGNNDTDGLDNLAEYNNYLDPTSDDTDGDTLSDSDEITIYGTHPGIADIDADGLNDSEEISNNTDAYQADTDNDGMDDAWEVLYNLDPTDPADAHLNLDSDLLTNYEEYYIGSNPNSVSSPPTLNASGHSSIQNAIDASAQPGIVILTAGTINEALTLPDRVVLYAASPASTALTSPYGEDIITVKNSNKAIVKNIRLFGAFSNGAWIEKSSVLFSGCVFYNNISLSSGGGINSLLSDIVLLNTTLESNRANNNGGGILADFSDITLRSCTLKSNRNYAIYAEYSNIMMRDSIIKDHFENLGYTVYFKSPIYTQTARLYMDNCEIFNCFSSINGGAISANDSIIELYNSKYHDNTSSRNGAALYIKNTSGNIVNTQIFENTSARYGGGIAMENSSDVDMIFSVVVNNSASTAGGVYVNGSTTSTIKNSILWGNGTDLFGTTSGLISYSDIEDESFSGENNNISQDPGFRNADKNDFHLIHTSPCINSATPTSTMIYDIDNEARPDITLYDMGVDEFVDTDNDGLPDFWENNYGGAVDPNSDDDTDNLTALDEYQYLTDPNSNDTDADGLTDYDEIFVYETDPVVDADKDGDGLTDAEEVNIHHTNPSKKDTDGDWMDDNWELIEGFDPLDNSDGAGDPDNDGLYNREEFFLNTDPSLDSSPVRIYVDSAALAEGNGSTGNPYKTLSYAVSHTSPGSQQVVLVLAAGTYDANINLKNNMSLLGQTPATTIIKPSSIVDETIEAVNVLNIVIKNVTITDSYTAIYADSAGLMVSNCIIKNNSALPTYGGGLNISDSEAFIFDSIIENNKASQYGGGIYCTNTTPVLYNCQIRDNQSENRGGGLYIANAPSATLRGTKLSGNTSKAGGGLYLHTSVTTITDVDLHDNTASDRGAGICTLNGELSVFNTAIYQNRALRYGGGVYLSSTATVIENCAIAYNSADLSRGHGLYNYQGEATIRNSIIWDNDTDDVYGFDVDKVQSCNLQDSTYSGENGNISVSPSFVNPDGGDFHILSSSLCVDAGTTTSLQSIDRDGETRPVNGMVDIGIDEVLDTDTDGLPDYWENLYGMDFTPASNDDGDALTNQEEYIHNTNPLLSDTDSDGLDDYSEIFTHNTDPRDNDSDDDGANDGLEINTYLSDPLLQDTDNDGMIDSWEGQYGLDPQTDDTLDNLDSDLLNNYEEYQLRSMPNDDTSPVIIYADNDAAAGGDGSVGAPYNTLQGAVDNALSPSIIVIHEGIYNESLVMPADKGLVLYSEQAQTVIINGNRIAPAISISDSDALTFIKNITIQNGKGGIYCYRSPLVVSGCIIRNNINTGILLEENLEPIKVINTEITLNTGSLGGGIWSYLSAPDIINCIISRNTALEGGGVWVASASGFDNMAPRIYHCTIADNVATSNTGGGIYNDNTKYAVVIQNSVLWGNGDDIYNIDADMISNSNVEDFSYGDNVVSVEPGFGMARFGKYHLSASSAMIDAGNATPYTQKDIHGEARLVNSMCDFGVDEFIDTDNDTLADVWELTFAANLSVFDNDSDFDNDGLNDSVEFLYFSDPTLFDTDGDSVGDAAEVSPHNTDPTNADTDLDGVKDNIEIAQGMNPSSSDSDNDGLPDGWELENGLDPTSAADQYADLDNDTLNNFEEFYMGSNPDNNTDPVFVYVDNDSPDGGNGSMGTPYTTLQDAIDASTPPYILSISGRFDESISFTDNFVIVGSDSKPTIIAGNSNYAPVVSLTNVTLGVIKNVTLTGGKPVVSMNQSELIFNNATISANASTSSNGGGIYVNDSALTLIDSTVSGCTASLRGGAIYCNNSDLKAVNTIIEDNHSNYDGGGVYATSSDVIVQNSKILDNSSNHYGGGMFVQLNSKLEIGNTVFAQNSAASGGGLHSYSASTWIDHSVFYKNSRTSGFGSSVSFANVHEGHIRHSIIWSNDVADEEEDLSGVNSAIVSDSNIEDDIGPTNNNISVNPIFAGPDYNNFRLRSGSPCIDAGAATSLITLDIDGDIRPEGSAVDIGIDEFSDTDSDGMQDSFEIKYFGDLSAEPDHDPDLDGRLNLDEYYQDKNPTIAD